MEGKFWILRSGFCCRFQVLFASGTWIPDSNRLLDFEFPELYSGFQCPKTRFLKQKFQFPDSGFPERKISLTWGELLLLNCWYIALCECNLHVSMFSLTISHIFWTSYSSNNFNKLCFPGYEQPARCCWVSTSVFLSDPRPRAWLV